MPAIAKPQAEPLVTANSAAQEIARAKAALKEARRTASSLNVLGRAIQRELDKCVDEAARHHLLVALHASIGGQLQGDSGASPLGD